MPELPEVETIRRQLCQKIVGKKLQGKEIVAVRRRGKILIIDFRDGTSLVFHLKLTGQLIYQGQPSSLTRQVFNFDDGSRLIFNDARKLSWCKEVKDTGNIEKALGPEALEISLNDFKALLTKKSKARIKPLLMDQKFIAGIGNIYSNEILFASGVQPLRLVKSLTEEEVQKIFHNIKKILNAAIKYHGSSGEYYVDACGREGKYAKYHKVYHKEKCCSCHTVIKKIKISGRSAYYCPKCQR